MKTRNGYVFQFVRNVGYSKTGIGTDPEWELMEFIPQDSEEAQTVWWNLESFNPTANQIGRLLGLEPVERCYYPWRACAHTGGDEFQRCLNNIENEDAEAYILKNKKSLKNGLENYQVVRLS